MKIVSVMQPYLFPYIGYFQLISASEVFVSLDDVQYIKRGWINRNRILLNGSPAWIILPVAYGSHRLKIHQRYYSTERDWRGKLLRQLEAAYHGAAHWAQTIELVRAILECNDTNVAALNIHALKRICNVLGIETTILEASKLDFDHGLHGPDLVAAICGAVGATEYLNPPGGATLYSADFFSSRDLKLAFIEPHATAYPQASAEFVPWLSIIDVMMNNGFEGAARLLGDYTLRYAGK